MNDLRERLRSDRPMTTISLRMPEDVVAQLKHLAHLLGFSGYQPLMRAYIGQGLRQDLERLEQDPGLDRLVESPATVRRRAKLPLVECAHEAKPGEEMTPERGTDALLEEEAEAVFNEEAMRAVVGCTRGRLGKTSDEWLDETRGQADERDR